MADTFQFVGKAEQRQRMGLLTETEAANQLGVSRDNLVWYLRTGQIIAPSAQIVGRPRKYYTSEDLTVLKSFFESKNAA